MSQATAKAGLDWRLVTYERFARSVVNWGRFYTPPKNDDGLYVVEPFDINWTRPRYQVGEALRVQHIWVEDDEFALIKSAREIQDVFRDNKGSLPKPGHVRHVRINILTYRLEANPGASIVHSQASYEIVKGPHAELPSSLSFGRRLEAQSMAIPSGDWQVLHAHSRQAIAHLPRRRGSQELILPPALEQRWLGSLQNRNDGKELLYYLFYGYERR